MGRVRAWFVGLVFVIFGAGQAMAGGSSCFSCSGAGCTPPGLHACFQNSDPCQSQFGCTLPGALQSGLCENTSMGFCPATEVGQCADGIDNEPDGATDCADPDCAGDPACGTRAPALGLAGLALIGAGLTAAGLWQVRRRKQ